MSPKKTVKDLLVLREQLEAAEMQCSGLSVIMQREHDAISMHDINRVEAIVSEKEAASQSLEALVQALLESLLSLGENLTQGQVELSLGLRIFDRIQEELADDIHSRTASYLVTECRDLLVRVLGVADRLRFEIHQNMMVIERMMEDHQESYRFWQTVGAEEGSQYGHKGERQSSGHCSQLIVKV